MGSFFFTVHTLSVVRACGSLRMQWILTHAQTYPAPMLICIYAYTLGSTHNPMHAPSLVGLSLPCSGHSCSCGFCSFRDCWNLARATSGCKYCRALKTWTLTWTCRSVTLDQCFQTKNACVAQNHLLLEEKGPGPSSKGPRT